MGWRRAEGAEQARARFDPRYLAALHTPQVAHVDGGHGGDWRDRGSYSGTDPEVFFPDEPGS